MRMKGLFGREVQAGCEWRCFHLAMRSAMPAVNPATNSESKHTEMTNPRKKR